MLFVLPWCWDCAEEQTEFSLWEAADGKAQVARTLDQIGSVMYRIIGFI